MRVKETVSFTRVKEAGVPGSFFTRALDTPSPGSFFGRRRRVGADDGNPMTPPPPHGVLGADEEDREDDDTGESILRGNQCRCGIVTHGYVVEDDVEDAALDALPQLPRGGVPVGWRRAVALVVRQLRETALRWSTFSGS
jgi:hypothetical protein